MPQPTFGDLLCYLRTTCDARASRDLTDSELLERFLAHREEAAFALLMQRHGPMVLGVCQRLLGNSHSAEDAFQATFLILVRQAASIRRAQSVGSWLHGVALRVASKAQARRRRERQVKQMPHAEPLDDLTWQELRSVLDEEIGRLPPKYQAPIVLCYLESKSYYHAAQELGWSKSTLAKRLGRARELLRRRLIQRGIALTGGTLAVFLGEKTARATVTALLTMNTMRAAASIVAGEGPAAGYLSTATAALVNNAFESRLPGTKTKLGLVVMAVLLVAGASLLGAVGAQDQPERSPNVMLQRLGQAPAGARAPEAAGNQSRLHLEVQQGHGNWVTSVVLSAGGKYLVTGSEDKRAILWETSSGKQIRTFEGHTARVTSLALSADGKHLFTGSADKTTAMWEMSSGKKLHTFQGQANWVESVALSADGKYLVTGSVDKTILWEVSSGKQVRAFQGHTGRITCVALSADGKHLLTGSEDETAILWETSSGNRIQTFQGYSFGITSVALSTDGKQVLTGSWDGRAILWEASSAKKLRIFRGHDSGVMSVMFSADGRQVLTGGDDGTAILWEVLSGGQRLRLRGHSYVMTGAIFSADGKHLWTSSQDCSTRLWDAYSGKELASLLTLDGGKNWLVTTADGFFDGSKGAWRYLAYRNSDTHQVLSDEATLQGFYRPGLLGLLLKGQKLTK
jgi:RNA polymerase sigma factor (sigma-70 family)